MAAVGLMRAAVGLMGAAVAGLAGTPVRKLVAKGDDVWLCAESVCYQLLEQDLLLGVKVEVRTPHSADAIGLCTVHYLTPFVYAQCTV